MLDLVTTLQVAAAAVSVAGAGGCLYALASSGRDRPTNELAVRTLIQTAPYERLNNVISKD